MGRLCFSRILKPLIMSEEMELCRIFRENATRWLSKAASMVMLSELLLLHVGVIKQLCDASA